MRIPRVTIILLAGLIGCGEVATSGTAKTDLPTITAIDPATGGAPGGAQITLTGTNFDQGTTEVVVGGRLASAVSVASATELTFTLPPGDEGATVDVTVFNDGGFGTLADSFTYNYRPTVLGVTPSLGKGAGGTAITITGRGFQNAGTPTITIAGGVATNVTVVDDRTITATTAPVAAGTKPFTFVDVEVTNDNGEGALSGAFRITTKGLILNQRGGGGVFHFDLDGTRELTQISSLARRVRGCALSPTDGKLYALSRGPQNNLQELVTFDPITGEIDVIGPTSDANNGPNRCVSTLSFVGGALYGMNTGNCGNTNRLVSIDPATGTTAVIGATPVSISRPNAIALKDAATVYYADRVNESLDTIAIATSVLTTGQPITGATTNSQAITAMANIGGMLYATDRGDEPTIYSLNPATGALTTLLKLPPGDWLQGVCDTPPTF